MIASIKCPKCGSIYTALSISYFNKIVVFDACGKCGTKLTNWKEQ